MDWDKIKETSDNYFKEKSKKSEEKREARKAEDRQFKEDLKRMKRQGIPYCKMCKSTKLEYVSKDKKLSVGRSIVGSALLGAPGAVLGGLTSKKSKGYVVCLNCGNKWRLR